MNGLVFLLKNEVSETSLLMDLVDKSMELIEQSLFLLDQVLILLKSYFILPLNFFKSGIVVEDTFLASSEVSHDDIMLLFLILEK